MVGDGVPSEFEENLRHGAQLIHDYAVSMGMPELEEDITAYVYHNFESVVNAHYDVYGKSHGISKNDIRRNIRSKSGSAYDKYVLISTSRFQNLNKGRQIQIMAHELSHAHHNILSGLSDIGPAWLNEGIAEFVAFRITPKDERSSYEMSRELIPQLNFSNTGPLEKIETRSAFNQSYLNYSYSLLAVELLASLSGESSLMQYYPSLRPGTTWQAEFKNIFDLSIGQFYDLFEQHEAAGFPKPEIPKFVER